MGKLIAFRRQRARDARRRRGQPPSPVAVPFLWIIAAGRPTAVLAEIGASSASDWPAGVYFGPGLFRVGIVVASELPRERSTLLVRLMAAGPLLPRAIEDLAVLPADAHERAVAAEILLNLHHALAGKPNRTPEEKEFIMTVKDMFEQARELGRAEEAARAVLTVLRVRGIAVPSKARKRVLAEKDLARLERWHERAILAASIGEVIDEPS